MSIRVDLVVIKTRSQVRVLLQALVDFPDFPQQVGVSSEQVNHPQKATVCKSCKAGKPREGQADVFGKKPSVL